MYVSIDKIIKLEDLKMNLFYLAAEASSSSSAADASTTAAQQTGFLGGYGSILIIVAIFAIMYFLMIRPQKKQQKKDAEMRNNLAVGDDIITIGGIMGRVVTVKEESIIIETGSDKNKMRILRSAVSRVVPNNEA